MKKLIAALSLCSVLAMTGCADSKVINGKKYEPCGLASKITDDACDANIKYKVSWGNVFLGIAFSEFFFIPTIYLFGWAMFEPDRAKTSGPN
jgi:hypothetical protein